MEPFVEQRSILAEVEDLGRKFQSLSCYCVWIQAHLVDGVWYNMKLA